MEKGEIEAAKEKFNRILEFKPCHAPAIFYLGEVALNGGDIERAVEFYDSALRHDDRLSGPYYRLAQCAMAQGKFRKARAYLMSELRHPIEDANLLVSMGSMFFTIATELRLRRNTEVTNTDYTDAQNEIDLDNATHCLFKSLDIDDANANAYYYLGLISLYKQLWEDAIEFFEHAIALDPDHVDAVREAARSYLYQGNMDEAYNKLYQARAVAMDHPGLKELGTAMMLRRLIHRSLPVIKWFRSQHQ